MLSVKETVDKDTDADDNDDDYDDEEADILLSYKAIMTSFS